MKDFFSRYGISIVYISVFAIILSFFVIATYDYQKTLRNNLLSEARIIAYQIRAVKNYVQRKQDIINRDSAGEYEFKGIHPDAAVKEIAEILKSTPYFTIRQVSLTPRNDENAPDRFESEKLNEFVNNPGLLELYGDSSIGGRKVFRYLIPLRADPTCLPCHGETKGNTDVTGHKKEGYKIGDVIGAISVIIQSYSKHQLLRRNISVLLIFIFALTIAIALIINSIRANFDERLVRIMNMEKLAPETTSSETFNALINDKFHKLLMHNLRNPVGDLLSSAEMLKDVPLNILESSAAAADKISAYSSRLIELKKLEQGKVDVLLGEFDFAALFKAKLKAYDNAARRKSVKVESKMASTIPNVHSDKNLLLKAVDNLFLFILRFTKAQTGRINISAEIEHYHDNNELVISMTSNISRIGTAYEHLVFEKFTDIKDLNDNFLFNTEVELVTAKFILKRLGCEIEFDSDNKEFNVFRIAIPLITRSGTT